MTEEQLAQAAQRLESSEEKFLTTVQLFVESLDTFRDYIKENRVYFGSIVDTFHETGQIMRDQVTLLREISAGLQAVVRAAGENNASVNENTEKMKALLTRVENYFGDAGGLEYDN